MEEEPETLKGTSFRDLGNLGIRLEDSKGLNLLKPVEVEEDVDERNENVVETILSLHRENWGLDKQIRNGAFQGSEPSCLFFLLN